MCLGLVTNSTRTIDLVFVTIPKPVQWQTGISPEGLGLFATGRRERDKEHVSLLLSTRHSHQNEVKWVC